MVSGYFHGEPEWLLIFNGFCGYFHGESEWLLIINGSWLFSW